MWPFLPESSFTVDYYEVLTFIVVIIDKTMPIKSSTRFYRKSIQPWIHIMSLIQCLILPELFLMLIFTGINFFHLIQMSSHNNHWTSTKESNNQINKLDEKHVYIIGDVQKLQKLLGKK